MKSSMALYITSSFYFFKRKKNTRILKSRQLLTVYRFNKSKKKKKIVKGIKHRVNNVVIISKN